MGWGHVDTPSQGLRGHDLSGGEAKSGARQQLSRAGFKESIRNGNVNCVSFLLSFSSFPPFLLSSLPSWSPC